MCTFCDGAEAAALVVTVQANGETVGVGQGCLAMYGMVLAGIEPALIDRVIAEAHAEAARREAVEAAADAGDTPAGEDLPPVVPQDLDTDEPAAGPVSGEQDPPAGTSPPAGGDLAESEAKARAHEARVKRALLDRPDSAATSEDDVPWPAPSPTGRCVAHGLIACQWCTPTAPPF